MKLAVNQPDPDSMGHIPSCLVRAETHVAMDLPRADAFLAGQHEVDDTKPVAKADVRVLKDRARDDGKAIAGRAAWGTLRALPVPPARMKLVNLRIVTARAANALRPATSLQIGPASVVMRERRL